MVGVSEHRRRSALRHQRSGEDEVSYLARQLELGVWLRDKRPKTIDSMADFLGKDLRARGEAGLLGAYIPEGRFLASDEVLGVQQVERGERQQQANLEPFRHLPQGAPTSPWLANLAAGDLDAAAAAYAARWDLRYTRYADDLTFSGDALPRRFVHEVSRIIQHEGFRVNRDKIVVRPRHTRQVVTGIVVNDRLAPAGIDRRTLRAMRHRLRHGGALYLARDEPLRPAQQRGHLAYWHMVDPSRVPWPVPELAPQDEGEEG